MVLWIGQVGIGWQRRVFGAPKDSGVIDLKCGRIIDMWNAVRCLAIITEPGWFVQLRKFGRLMVLRRQRIV